MTGGLRHHYFCLRCLSGIPQAQDQRIIQKKNCGDGFQLAVFPGACSALFLLILSFKSLSIWLCHDSIVVSPLRSLHFLALLKRHTFCLFSSLLSLGRVWIDPGSPTRTNGFRFVSTITFFFSLRLRHSLPLYSCLYRLASRFCFLVAPLNERTNERPVPFPPLPSLSR